MATTGAAQSFPHCYLQGTWLPVEEVRGKTPYVFDGDELLRGSADSLELLPAEEFAPGFVNIEVLRNARPGVYNDRGVLRFTAPRSWYRLKANLVAETDLEDCYFVLRFDKYGESVYLCKGLGDLKKGEPRVVEVFMRVNYEMPQQLHLFSGLGELRTSLVPQAYRIGSSGVARAEDSVE